MLKYVRAASESLKNNNLHLLSHSNSGVYFTCCSLIILIASSPLKQLAVLVIVSTRWLYCNFINTKKKKSTVQTTYKTKWKKKHWSEECCSTRCILHFSPMKFIWNVRTSYFASLTHTIIIQNKYLWSASIVIRVYGFLYPYALRLAHSPIHTHTHIRCSIFIPLLKMLSEFYSIFTLEWERHWLIIKIGSFF